MFGAGMSGIPLGTGCVDIAGVYNALVKHGYDGYSTLEIAGDAAVKQSYEFLKSSERNRPLPMTHWRIDAR